MSDNAGFYGPTVGNQPNTMQDYGNRRAEWGPASMDIRHNWISSCNYELPVGRGKRLLGDASGLANTVLGGWMTSGVLTFRTGLPLTIGETPDTSNAGSSSPRPDAIRNGNLPRGSRGPDNWFDTTAYARAPGGQHVWQCRRGNHLEPRHRQRRFRAPEAVFGHRV